MLQVGKTYTSNFSDLNVTILEILEYNEKYVHAKVAITNKRDTILFEANQSYKIRLNKILDWKEVSYE